MNRHIITLVALACLSFNVNADEIQLQKNHPDRHVVVKGDTLWGISGKFLKDPWQWPKVWKMNREQIKNPHLIYPGDTIYFSIVNGRPQLSLSRNEYLIQSQPDSTCVLNEEDVKNGRTEFAVSEDGKLLPCIRETPIKQAIELIPAESIRQFLTSPKVVAENELNTEIVTIRLDL